MEDHLLAPPEPNKYAEAIDKITDDERVAARLEQLKTNPTYQDADCVYNDASDLFDELIDSIDQTLAKAIMVSSYDHRFFKLLFEIKIATDKKIESMAEKARYES